MSSRYVEIPVYRQHTVYAVNLGQRGHTGVGKVERQVAVFAHQANHDVEISMVERFNRDATSGDPVEKFDFGVLAHP